MPTAGAAKNRLNAPCPQCGQPAPLDIGNGWRPFCSERCKLLDLGEWFSERYTVPADTEADTPQDDGGTLQ
jgi:endogenous inhibitor of DNA gyrase (YacG/DUF329 family)